MEDLSGHPWAKLPVQGSQAAEPSIPQSMAEFVDASREASTPVRDILPEHPQATPREVVYGGGSEQPSAAE